LGQSAIELKFQCLFIAEVHVVRWRNEASNLSARELKLPLVEGDEAAIYLYVQL
jgi:hypothetical protein